MSNTIRTFKDLLDALSTLGYSPSMIKQIRPKIKMSERIYKSPLNRITVDPADFDKRWGTGRVGALASGFKSTDEFIEWRRRVRGVITKIQQAAEAPVVITDSWMALIEMMRTGYIDGFHVKKKDSAYQSLRLSKISTVCSAAMLDPQDLTAENLSSLTANLNDKERQKIRYGISTINKLRSSSKDRPDLARLLPEQDIGSLASRYQKSGAMARGNKLSKQLWIDFDEVILTKRQNTDVSHVTVANYEALIAAMSGRLHELGELEGLNTIRLTDVCQSTLIQIYANDYLKRQSEGHYKKNSACLANRIRKITHIAKIATDCKDEMSRLDKLYARVRKVVHVSDDEMSPDRLEWIQNFSRSPTQKRALQMMPEVLMKKTNLILRDWDLHRSKSNFKILESALTMGMTAVIAAILFRATPMRAKNVRNLKIYGDDRNISHNDDYSEVEFYVEAENVKNKHAIAAPSDGDVGHILKWYIEEIRPLVITPGWRKPLVDSDYLFPSMSFDEALHKEAFSNRFEEGCRMCGINMTLHQARHVVGYLILSVNPSAIGAVASLLNISQTVARKHYAWMDKQLVDQHAVQMLKQSRDDVRKHRPATHVGVI